MTTNKELAEYLQDLSHITKGAGREKVTQAAAILLSFDAQRIEALEAELAALRDSECDKIMAMSETQINALTHMQGSNPEDIAQLGRMTARAAIKDVEIARLRAELAALRASTYDKETINTLVHTITRNDEAEDSIEDLKNAADMLKGKSILDALNAEYDNAAELAACKTEIAVERSSRCMFVSRIENCGVTPMTGEGVLALLNDCDMLASREFDLPSRLEVTYGDAVIDAAMAAGEKA